MNDLIRLLLLGLLSVCAFGAGFVMGIGTVAKRTLELEAQRNSARADARNWRLRVQELERER